MEHSVIKRWASLDYLRGLMALAILVFHFDKWTSGRWDSTTVQGKLGVYAVSIFFVLSGMALMVTYQRKMTAEWRSVAAFAIKRVFRIFPVLWMATAATILLEEAPRPFWDIFLNFSGLFGFWDASRDIATGAWSIGCELAFYAFFPALLFLANFRAWTILVATAILAWIGLRGAYAWPFEMESVVQSIWWSHYVQGQYHVFFFTAGIAMVVYRKYLESMPRKVWQVLLVICALAFVWAPVGMNPQSLVSGNMRLFLSGLVIVATASWSFGLGNITGVSQKVLSWLGSVSYALYLLHPLVFRVVKALLVRGNLAPEVLLLPLAFLGSLLASHFVYHFIEKPVLHKGRALAQQLTNSTN